MSPPMTPAPMTCTRRALKPESFAMSLQFSISQNTRRKPFDVLAVDQARNALGFLVQHGTRIVTMLFPGIDHFERGGVVVRVGLGRRLLAHLPGQEFTCRCRCY